MKKQIVIAFIRTSLVPPLAGFILAWLVKHGITANAVWLNNLLVIGLAGIYYIILHVVEVISKNPIIKKWAGIFLGYPSQPQYKEK